MPEQAKARGVGKPRSDALRRKPLRLDLFFGLGLLTRHIRTNRSVAMAIRREVDSHFGITLLGSVSQVSHICFSE